ncbi:MAG: dicarboxylate/amino acid:cation symporter [Spirulina sp. SIO3F2]|nr:dicarboxylate/amino acid:cation symporter [Spirulina sp. SIO3F2]
MTTSSQAPQKPGFEIFLNLLANPWAIVVSLILGILIGAKFQDIAAIIAPIGKLYIALFKMCVLPILLSGITMSIGRLMTRPDAAEYIKRILIFFPAALVATTIVAVLVGIITAPGSLDAKTLDALGGVIRQSGVDLEITLSGPLPEPEPNALVEFMLGIIPDNIFNALTNGQTLQILFFVILFGLGLGFVPREASENLFTILEGVYGSFNKLIDWLKYLLPFGLCSLLADQISQVGVETLLTMLKFVLVSILMFAIFYVLNTVIVSTQCKKSIWEVFAALKETTILALATRSSLASMPSAINEMIKSLNFEPQTANLVVPLSITLCRFGSVAYFALGTVFVAQLYEKSLGIGDLAIILVGSLLAGMATSGVSGILTLTMMGLVLTPLKLPLDAVLVLFVAVDPIVDPFRTLTIVHAGVGVTALIADQVDTKNLPPQGSQSTPEPA